MSGRSQTCLVAGRGLGPCCHTYSTVFNNWASAGDTNLRRIRRRIAAGEVMGWLVWQGVEGRRESVLSVAGSGGSAGGPNHVYQHHCSVILIIIIIVTISIIIILHDYQTCWSPTLWLFRLSRHNQFKRVDSSQPEAYYVLCAEGSGGPRSNQTSKFQTNKGTFILILHTYIHTIHTIHTIYTIYI